MSAAKSTAMQAKWRDPTYRAAMLEAAARGCAKAALGGQEGLAVRAACATPLAGAGASRRTRADPGAG